MLAVVALVLAGAAAFLVKVFLERQSQPVIVQEQAPQGVVKVLVASRSINPGEVLNQKDVTWADWPKALLTERLIEEKDLVLPSATVPPTEVGMIVRTEETPAASGEAEVATKDGKKADTKATTPAGATAASPSTPRPARHQLPS
jgi:Flp pilus assembly protein CpaB